MSANAVVNETRFDTDTATSGLIEILLNPLILCNIVPYLPVSALLNLAATSHGLRRLIYDTPGSLRHLDLTRIKAAQFLIDDIDHGGQVWRNVQLDEYLTEDDFYSGPLRGIFTTLKRRDILSHVQTLILDGLSVTAELCSEIINDPSYRVRLLSVRDTRNLNHGKLRGALQYACRATRPEGTPRLKALYIFGAREPPEPPATVPTLTASRHTIGTSWNEKSQRQLTTSLLHEGDSWWEKKGRVIGKQMPTEWALCLMACEGLIAFDAVLCQGPRHRNSCAPSLLPDCKEPHVATFAVPPCRSCHAAPEGVLTPKSSRFSLPLLSPPPLLSSTVLAAVSPQNTKQSFVPRCSDCLINRYCSSCNSWWCEDCFGSRRDPHHRTETVPGRPSPGEYEGTSESMHYEPKAPITKSCWECGANCHACIEATQFVCKKCNGGYCIRHNEGSTSNFCDWCVCQGRGLNRL
ncbi:hypothetical protein NLU13_3774 [Sarocladium strictum]|uniref:F-box domain-containing protein n=1 Tax=Sarocladium strictum TaxID=5046 RepID=A0AA39L815_SARSR|nr:hypothetical protein NLU13_3774 [Sarocladium strictum]